MSVSQNTPIAQHLNPIFTSLPQRQDGPSPAKARRVDDGSERYSDESGIQRPGSASDTASKAKKKRISNSAANARTGQACDRCKHRKIRCDNTQGGCLPCRQNHTECKTTDRNTNTVRARGHTEAVEREAHFLHVHIAELHQQLRELGAEPRNTAGYGAPGQYPQPYAVLQGPPWGAPPHQPAVSYHQGAYHDPQSSGTAGSAANVFAQSAAEISSEPSPTAIPREELSIGIGSPLSIFGMTLDLADFVAQEEDSRRSRSAMVKTVMMAAGGRQQELRVELPEQRKNCMSQVAAFLRVCNSWMPMLHGPDVTTLVDRVYKEQYQPTSPERVVLHVCLANIMYQTAARNLGDEMLDVTNRMADQQFHCALSYLPDLLSSKTLEDIQAMTMLCFHLRCLPDWTAANELLSVTFRAAIEIGLHRSASSLPDDERPTDIKTIEIRKRLFWSLLLMYVPICGKLSQPMPVQPEDFDTEIPELLNDNLQPAEGSFTGDGKCKFFHAVALMKLCKLFLRLYRTVYAPHRPSNYEQRRGEIGADLELWKEHDWPAVLKGPLGNLPDAHRVMAIWLHWWSNQFLMLLHHPTRQRLGSMQHVGQKTLEDTLAICSELTQNTLALYREKALDTTWGHTLTFIGTIFTLLWCLDKREQALSTSDLAKTKGEVESCLEVISGIGLMLGSGPKLRDRVKEIVNSVFDRIKNKHSQRIASAAVAKANLKSPSSTSSSRDYVPASTSVYHQRSTSTTQQQPQQAAQTLSPSTGYQTTGDEAVVNQYGYNAYNNVAQGYHEQHYMYGTPNVAQYQQNAAPQTNDHGWNQYHMAQEYLQSMEPANALMALHQGEMHHGETQPGQQQHAIGLMPSGGVRGPEHWPEGTWGVEEGKVDH